MNASPPPEIKRVLKIRDLFAIGYGDVGSSIYYALGITALFALGATPIALVLAGIVFVCTALTYAEMTSMSHDAGGSASFARLAFNDIVSFVAGWGLLLDYVVTIAISSFAVVPYLSWLYPPLKSVNMQTELTIALIAILFIVNLLGVRQSVRMSLILISCTLLTQAVIIAIGFVFLSDLTVFEHIQINVANAAWSPTWPQFWKGTAMAMVAYTGIESIAQLGSETRAPAKTVPRAIMWTLCTVLVMYLSISVIGLSAMSPQELGSRYLQDPLAGIAAHLPFGSAVLAPWIGLLAAALLFVAANAGMVGASRLSFNMGKYYQLPGIFYRLDPKRRTPIASLAVFGVLAALVVIWSRGNMTFLADLYNFGAMIAFFSAHLSLIVMRIKKPEAKRPFKIPLNIHLGKYEIPLTAVIGCFATASVWILVVATKEEGRHLGLTWLGLGFVLYLIYRRTDSKRRRLS